MCKNYNNENPCTANKHSIAPTRSHGLLKIPVPVVGHFPLSCWPECFRDHPQSIGSIAIVLDLILQKQKGCLW